MLHQLSIWYNLILSSLNNIVLIWSANTYKDTIYSYFTVQILEKYGLNSGREEIGKWYPYLGNRVLVICDIAYIVILRATGNNSFTGSSNLNSQFILRQIWPWMIRHSLWSFSYTIPHTSLNPLLLNQVTTYYWMYVSREHWGVGGGSQLPTPKPITIVPSNINDPCMSFLVNITFIEVTYSWRISK